MAVQDLAQYAIRVCEPSGGGICRRGSLTPRPGQLGPSQADAQHHPPGFRRWDSVEAVERWHDNSCQLKAGEALREIVPEAQAAYLASKIADLGDPAEGSRGT